MLHDTKSYVFAFFIFFAVMFAGSEFSTTLGVILGIIAVSAFILIYDKAVKDARQEAYMVTKEAFELACEEIGVEVERVYISTNIFGKEEVSVELKK